MSRSLEVMLEMEQALHNLKMRWPTGILSVDLKHEERKAKLEQRLLDMYERLYKLGITKRKRLL